MSTPLLEIRALSAALGGKHILENISLFFEPNTLYGIIGPNGSGKTTLLRHLCGILRPENNTVFLDGKTDINRITRKELAKRIAFLPQHRIIPDIPVETLVRHGRYPHLGFSKTLSEEDLRIVSDAMQNTGVFDLSDRMLPTLSGGERQRAYIAMLLSQNADITLLDEPTNYLDARYKFETIALMRRLCENGKTAVAVLHDLPLAFSCCDKLILLENGHIAAIGTPEEIYESGEADRVFKIAIHRTATQSRILYTESAQE